MVLSAVSISTEQLAGGSHLPLVSQMGHTFVFLVWIFESGSRDSQVWIALATIALLGKRHSA